MRALRNPTGIGRFHGRLSPLVLTSLLLALWLPYAAAGAREPTISVDFRDGDLVDVLHAIATVAKVSMVVDSSVKGRASIKLKDVTVPAALDAILKQSDYSYHRQGDVYVIGRTPSADELVVTVDATGRVTLHARNADLAKALLEVSKQARLNLVPEPGMVAKISLELTDCPVAEALRAIAFAGQYQCRESDGVWTVARTFTAPAVVGETGVPIASVKPSDTNQDVHATDGALRASSGIDGTVDDLPPDGKVGTRSIHLRYLRASEVLEYLGKIDLLEVSGRSGSQGFRPVVRATKEDHVLLVTGTAESIANIQSEVLQIDQPPPQITLEAKIVEVYANKNRDLGMLLGKITDGQFAVDLMQGQLAYATGDLTQKVNVIVQSLVQEGKAKVIASPSICTLAGHEAMIDIGQVRYFKVSSNPDSQPGTQPAPYYYPTTTLQTISAGVVLKLTPWVGATGQITASIQPEVSSVTGITPEGLPEVNRRKVATTVRVRNGDTIVIGGLKQEEDTKSTSKVPLLGDLPLLGALFTNTKTISRESELLIFITPRIMPSSASEISPANPAEELQTPSPAHQ